jgi:tetratricopeptide (TPR) repeat protein
VLYRLALIVLLAAAFEPSGTDAQTYSEARPVPRTTNHAILVRLAVDREIHERFRIGFDQELHGRWKEAVAEFTRIISLHPREPQDSTAWYNLGLAQAQTGAYGAATASFNAAIEHDDGFIAARVNLVSVDLLRKDLRSAHHDADELIARVPSSSRALYEHGIVALDNGDAQAALRDFDVLLRRDPSYAIGRYDFALAEIAAGRLSDAERELRGALAIVPTFARARFALGAVLLRQGNHDQARTAFDQAAHDANDVTLRNLASSMKQSL